jgi:hypothetical protein
MRKGVKTRAIKVCRRAIKVCSRSRSKCEDARKHGVQMRVIKV